MMILSGTVVTLSLTWWGVVRHWEICVLGAAALLSLLCLKGRMLERIFAHPSLLRGLLALGIAACAWPLFAVEPRTNFALLKWLLAERLALPARLSADVWATLSAWLYGAAWLLLLPALFTYAYAFCGWLTQSLRRVLSRADRVDRLWLVIVGVLGPVLLWLAFSRSDAFYGASAAASDAPFDILFTSDSAVHFQQNVFAQVNAVENDIRQPLFGLFTLPFAAVALQLAALVPACPYLYPLLIATVQVWLLALIAVLLRQWLAPEGLRGALFLALIGALYPMLLFTVMMEQYVFAVFWLLLLVDAHLRGAQERDLLFVAATGSLLASALSLPLVPSVSDWRGFFRQAAKGWARLLG